ncbi:TPA: hypothetical protein ACWMJU_006025 [Pseudomonas aeruginosa]
MSKGSIMDARYKLDEAFVDYVLGFHFYKETKDSRLALKSIIYPIYISFQIVILPLFTLLLICLIAMLTSLAIMPFENSIADSLADIIINNRMIAEEYYYSQPYSQDEAIFRLYFYAIIGFIFIPLFLLQTYETISSYIPKNRKKGGI